MSGHLYDAQDLKDKYPKCTDGFTVFEVERIWEEHSETRAAGWLIPDEASVCEVFDHFRR